MERSLASSAFFTSASRCTGVITIEGSEGSPRKIERVRGERAKSCRVRAEVETQFRARGA